MTTHRIVSGADWLEARKALLAKEKAFTQQREELAQERRALPWVKVEKDYVFEAPEGKVTLADLFDGKGQLIVQHFMFGPDWNEGCPSCSYWADNFNGIDAHWRTATPRSRWCRAGRSTGSRLIAGAWLEPRWVSSLHNDFNFDFAVSFPPDEKAPRYNFGTIKPYGQETPGLSAFRRGDDGAIYRTYSTYARGLDMLNGAYQLLDITSKGRDEDGLKFSMKWLKRHDKY